MTVTLQACGLSDKYERDDDIMSPVFSPSRLTGRGEVITRNMRKMFSISFVVLFHVMLCYVMVYIQADLSERDN